MKLYTEEQLHNTVIAISNYLDDINLSKSQDNIQKHLKALQPIELPSDEEIEESANIYAVSKRQLKNLSNKEFDFSRNDFIKGAKWMKEQILNQNK